MCLVPAPGEFWALRNDFSKGVATRNLFVAVFAKNESLYRRISTKYCKYKSSKLFWRILEDNKQNKHENGDNKTVRIFACRSPIRLSLQHRLLKHNEFLPAWPSLSFLPSNPCLFWWIISTNSCLFVFNQPRSHGSLLARWERTGVGLVFNSIFRWKPKKTSVCVK